MAEAAHHHGARTESNAQIILTTHSPALIMDGWEDAVTEVSEITL